MHLRKILRIVSIQLMLDIQYIGCTNTSTICYGSNPSCTTHKLSCLSPLVIQIINTSYGYRPGCKDVIGLADCSNTTCCNEEPGDCFIPFSSEDNQHVVENCSEVETCQLSRLRRYNTTHTVCNGRIVNAYSKIQYDCVIKGKHNASNSDVGIDDKEDNDDITGAVVGGIFGAIITVIIILVGVFLYKRNKNAASANHTTEATTQSTDSPYYHVTDDPGTIKTHSKTGGYQQVDVNGEPKLQATRHVLQHNLNPSTNKIHNDNSGYDEIDLDDEPKLQTPDNYDHVGDDNVNLKPPKKFDNYNHIGNHNHDIHEDNYNHIGNNLSTSPGQFETDYDHINGVLGTSKDEDDYNHIGNHDNKKVITDDNYHHIG